MEAVAFNTMIQMKIRTKINNSNNNNKLYIKKSIQ